MSPFGFLCCCFRQSAVQWSTSWSSSLVVLRCSLGRRSPKFSPSTKEKEKLMYFSGYCDEYWSCEDVAVHYLRRQGKGWGQKAIWKEILLPGSLRAGQASVKLWGAKWRTSSIHHLPRYYRTCLPGHSQLLMPNSQANRKILKHLSQQCVFYCMPLPPEFLQVYHNSTVLFLSYFALLLPFLLI